MELAEGEGAVTKTRAQPEFGVALVRGVQMGATKAMQDRACVVWEIRVERGVGSRPWVGVGLTVPSIAMNESPRQQSQGKSWFYHDRGFLCDGNVFVDDSLPPFAWEEGEGAMGGLVEACRVSENTRTHTFTRINTHTHTHTHTYTQSRGSLVKGLSLFWLPWLAEV